MELFETHAHLDVLEDLETELEQARAAGVHEFMLPAVSPFNWQACIETARANTGIYFGLGIHPQCVRELTDSEASDSLQSLPDLIRSSGAHAIGELGLDWRWDSDPDARLRQERIFLEQLDIAAETGLPPIIHCLDAHGRFLELWKSHPCRKNTPGIMHSYSGSAEMVAEYVRENLYISYSGAVTWTHAKRVPKACKATPLERLLIETDAPYQPPHPLEEGPNRLPRLVRVAEVVAGLLGLSIAEVAQITTQNARTVFGL